MHSNILSAYSPPLKDDDTNTHERGTPLNPLAIALAEPSSVLELLFQFTYNQPQPDLSSVAFNVLSGLTVAVEKYKVYAASESCKSRLREFITQHPLRVLHIGSTYKYTTIIDEAAPQTIGLPIKDIQSTLKPNVFNAWVRYHRSYLDLLGSVYTYQEPTRWHWEGLKDKPGVKAMDSPCEVWTELYAKVAYRFAGKPENLVGGRVDDIFHQTKEVIGLRCMSCPRWVTDWHKEVVWKVSKLKPFSSYL
ncbi:hypothetical protein ONZ45_g11434 [Pleurotus djamor]|nr:hypothetical protein ONZ45_g11434 [Pleurotus djamor]